MREMKFSVAVVISAILAAVGALDGPVTYPENQYDRLRYPRKPYVNDTAVNYTCQDLPDSPWFPEVVKAAEFFRGPKLEFCGSQHSRTGCSRMYRFRSESLGARNPGVRVVACGTRDTTCWDVADMLDGLLARCRRFVGDHAVVGGSHWFGHGLVRDSFVWLGGERSPAEFPPTPDRPPFSPDADRYDYDPSDPDEPVGEELAEWLDTL